MDENGAKVFDASYYAWGKLTVAPNTIGLHRGFTSRGMLSVFLLDTGHQPNHVLPRAVKLSELLILAPLAPGGYPPRSC